MVQGNRLGDIEITDPKAMRALAHPVRLALLERLQRYGPATATQLSPHVGATPSVTSWHLRHLAGFGLVRDAEVGGDRRERRWEAVARGFRVEVPEGGEGQSAAEYLQITKKNVENLKCMVAMSNQILGGTKSGAAAQAWLMCMTGTDNPGNGHGVPGAIEGWLDPAEKVLDIGIGPLADALGGAKDLYDMMNKD